MASYQLQTLEVYVPIPEYLQTCVDVQRFLPYCRECENYGQRWSCPPYSFRPESVWEQYTGLQLYARVMTFQEGADQRSVIEGRRREKDILLRELLKREKENPGAMALSAGTCMLCQTCTRPSGETCQHPEKMRYSLEALGGNVVRTAEQYLHKRILWIKGEEIPEYLMLVGGLLIQ